MSQHLPTSISYTKLEIATYIHEIADKLLPSTTSQYILLGTTQLAPNTTLHYNSQYYFVLQNLHKVLPSTTLYYKACTKSFPVCYNLLLQNRISTPKQEKDDFEAFFKRNFKRKITSAKFAKICWQMTIAAWMQPLQYDLQSSAAKDNSITHAAAAASNLEAATPMRSAETELQITIELSATASEIAAPKPDGSRRRSRKKTILKHFLKGILKGKLLAPNLRKSADKWLSQPGCSHSNTIYNLQLQKTIVLRMQPRRQATLRQPLQCDLQPEIPKHTITTHTQPHPKQLAATVTMRQKKTTNRPQPQPSHTRGTFHRRLQPLYTEKHKVSCSGFLPKT